MSIANIKLELEGRSALIMHNPRTCNYFDKYAKALRELNREKKRKGSDMESILTEMAHMEFLAGLYCTERSNGIYLPWRCARKAFVEAARMTKEGKQIERAVNCAVNGFPLLYNGPKDPEELWLASTFIDQRPVKVGKATIIRTRPIFEEWGVEVEMIYETDLVQEEDLVRFVRDAGRFQGFGDGRDLGYGRYNIVAVNGKAFNDADKVAAK